MENPGRFETFTRARLLDGSQELVYEYETPDSEVDHAMYLNVTARFERKVSDAVVAAGAERMTIKLAFKASGIEREIETFYPRGDASEFHVLEKDGKPIGSHFITRTGKSVCRILMSGMYFDDAEQWESLVKEKMDRFETDKISV
jgi:hypothetical protein